MRAGRRWVVPAAGVALVAVGRALLADLVARLLSWSERHASPDPLVE
ncbi:hypothetical protein [Diaminobutyricimonas aerilata]|nr:hypothetical protein [Diaminobutyricimonas aerilata]